MYFSLEHGRLIASPETTETDKCYHIRKTIYKLSISCRKLRVFSTDSPLEPFLLNRVLYGILRDVTDILLQVIDYRVAKICFCKIE